MFCFILIYGPQLGHSKTVVKAISHCFETLVKVKKFTIHLHICYSFVLKIPLFYFFTVHLLNQKCLIPLMYSVFFIYYYSSPSPDSTLVSQVEGLFQGSQKWLKVGTNPPTCVVVSCMKPTLYILEFTTTTQHICTLCLFNI